MDYGRKKRIFPHAKKRIKLGYFPTMQGSATAVSTVVTASRGLSFGATIVSLGS